KTFKTKVTTGKGKKKKSKIVTKQVAYTYTLQVPHVRYVPRYTPDTLVGTMTLAGAPKTQPGSYYELTFDNADCGTIVLDFNPGDLGTGDNAYAFLGNCDPLTTDPNASKSFEFHADVAGNTITFALPFAQLGDAHVQAG